MDIVKIIDLSFDTHNLSKYRNNLMGFAIIWVLLYHFHLSCPIFKEVSMVGYAGVDIFLFLSGFGLFYSLNKMKNYSFKVYFAHRIRRIFPTYIVVGFFLSMFILHDSFYLWLWKSTTLGFWTNSIYYEWYVPSLVFCYLIFPLGYKLLIKNDKYYLYCLFLAILLPLPFMITGKCGFWQYHLLYRLPLFFWGAFVAQRTIFSSPNWNRIYCIVSLSCLIIGIIMGISLQGHFIQYAMTFATPALSIMSTSIHNSKINLIMGGGGRKNKF